MKKMYIFTFSVSVITLFIVAVVLTMIMTPTNIQSVGLVVKDYNSVDAKEYTYMPTKDITTENLTKEYTITSENVAGFQKYNNYKPGNSNPFTPQTDVNSASNVNNSTQNTTNSNGGTANPPSSGK